MIWAALSLHRARFLPVGFAAAAVVAAGFSCNDNVDRINERIAEESQTKLCQGLEVLGTGPVEVIGLAIQAPGGEEWLPCYRKTVFDNWTSVEFLRIPEYSPKGLRTVLATADVVDFSATVDKDPELKALSTSELLETVGRELVRYHFPSRAKPITWDMGPAMHIGAECLRYDISVEDRAVPGFEGNLFLQTAHGYVCVQPNTDGLMFVLEYSERRPEEIPPVEGLEAEGEAYLDAAALLAMSAPP